MSSVLRPLGFVAVVIAVACTFLGELYLLFGREPSPDKKRPRKIIVSNLK
jgi:hypothetical protein